MAGVSRRRCGTSASVPVTPSAARLASSPRSSSGLPPVSSRQASWNAGDGSDAQRPAHQFRAGGRAQRGRAQRDHARLRGQTRGQRLLLCRPQPGLADGEHQHHGQAFQAAGQIGDEPLRRLIRPVQVVDRQQQRCALRDVDGQPVQAVQDRERVLIASRLAAGQGQGGQRHRVVRPPLPAALGPYLGLEQLPYHAPGVPVLELGGARRQHRHACLGRLFARMPQQARLADSRLALHQQRRPRTRACRFDRGRDRGEIRRPVQQLEGDRTPRPHARDRRPVPGLSAITEPCANNCGTHRDAPAAGPTITELNSLAHLRTDSAKGGRGKHG